MHAMSKMLPLGMGNIGLVVAFVGCSTPTTQVISDFVVTLEPLTLTSQEPFSQGRQALLQLRWPDGEVEVLPLGTVDGERAAVELPPLLAGTHIALAIQEPSGNVETIDLDELVAWGEVEVEEDVDTGAVTLSVLVAEVGRPGTLGSLSVGNATMAGALATGPGGDVFLFGGHDPDAGAFSGSRNDVRKLSNPSAGDWGFARLDFDLPMVQSLEGTDMIGRAGISATSVVGKDDAELIFLFGGRDNWATSDLNTAAGALFDPVAAEIVWEGGAVFSRSEHDALLLEDGRVFLSGGLQGLGTAGANWEIFNPRRERFEGRGVLFDHGVLSSRSASLGPRGAMVCGGLERLGTLEWHPLDSCTGVGLDEQVSQLAPLPMPRGGHAMATLTDGRVLVVGGFSETIIDVSPAVRSEVDATADAFLYDRGTDTWETVGQLNLARSNAALIPMPDGSAVVVGGTVVGGGLYAAFSPAVECPERFDVGTQTFEVLPCVVAGAGANPSWARVQGQGAVVLEGFTQVLTAIAGGREFGWIGQGPQ